MEADTSVQHISFFYILATFTEEIHHGKLHFLCSESYILEKASFQESNIPHYLHFLENYFFQWLLFQKTYFFTTYIFRKVTDSQLGFLSTDTLPIYQSVIKWAHHQLLIVKVWGFFLLCLLLLKVAP